MSDTSIRLCVQYVYAPAYSISCAEVLLIVKSGIAMISYWSVEHEGTDKWLWYCKRIGKTSYFSISFRFCYTL